MARTTPLFTENDVAPVEAHTLVAVDPEAPSLRVVYFPRSVDSERPCLVLCANGERNVRTIRRLTTLCGTSCEAIESTSAIPPAKLQYCATCLSLAGKGVLR
jgi:hypothetical protein